MLATDLETEANETKIGSNMQNAESVLNLTVLWRGEKYIIEMHSDASLKELGDELQKLTAVKADTMRFIVPQFSSKSSKLLFPFSNEHAHLTLREASLHEERAIRMMGVSEDEVDKVLQDAKINMRIAGFDEEEKRMKKLMSARSPSLLKLPPGPYIFCDFRTLQLPGIELNPPASEALKRMHMLAADPGIVAIMNKHRWRVGIMTEMAPVGYVGVSPKCILGFNKNHGEEISLRLRTDDLKGFRKYESIKKTLLHELAHMVYSEHDANFFALDRQLNEESSSLDWTKSTGHTLSGVKYPAYYDEEYYSSDNSTTSQKLGGDAAKLPSVRETSVAAAYRRLVDMSPNSTGVFDDHVEPDPDDSSLTLHDELDVSDYIGGQNICVKHMDLVCHKPDGGPDHDGLSCDHNKCEPDPDDCQGYPAKLMETLNCRIHPGKTFDEPDPDDLEMEQNFVGDGNVERLIPSESIVTESHELQGHRNEAHREPDPDDLEVEHESALGEIMERPNQDDSVVTGREEQFLENEARREPDPDDLLANRSVVAEPDADVVVVPSQEISSMQIDEPGLDDQELQRIQDPVTVVCNRLQKAIAILRSEVSPHEATAAVQTLFKIIRNVIEHPDEMKFKRLRKSNPTIQKNVANHQAAMEILRLVGFGEDVVFNEIGREETYLVLKRNDPGLLWLVKSSLEASVH